MRTPNNSSNYEQEYYRDADGNPHYIERTSGTKNPNAYTHGYSHGRAVERSHQNDLARRDSENTARGLLVGVLLASLAAIGSAYAWYLNQPDSRTNSVPESSQPAPSPQKQTTIIEKVKEVPVERIREVPVERVKEVPVAVPVPAQNTAEPEVTEVPQQPVNQNVFPTTDTPESKMDNNQGTQNAEPGTENNN